MTAESKRDRWSRVRASIWNESAVLQALVVLVYWMTSARSVLNTPSTSVDGSFCAALGEFFVRGARAGVDWVYTWGPLGWLEADAFDPRLWIARHLIGEVLLKLVCCGVIVHALWRRPTVMRAIGIATLFVLPVINDPLFLCALYAAFELVLDQPSNRARTVTLIALVSVFGLIKFSLFLLGSVFLALVFVLRWRAISRASAFRFAAVFVVVFLALWTMGRQSWLDLPAFLAWSMRISSGYAEGMATATPDGLLFLAAWAGGCVLVRVLSAVSRRDVTAAELARAVGVTAVAFLAFKEGFVRASDHTPLYFAILGPAAILYFPLVERARSVAPTLAGERTRGLARASLRAARTGALLATLLVCYLGVVATSKHPRALLGQLGYRIVAVDEGWTALTSASRLGEIGMKDRENVRRAWEMPSTRERVGDQGIDLVPNAQGILITHDWNWAPRPVFQSYLTFDEPLQRLNADHLESAAAAPWMLLQIDALDSRWPTLDDALALRVLARDFDPVGAEQGFLLLRRAADAPRPDSAVIVLERRLRFGEELELGPWEPGVYSLAANIHPTALGRIRDFAYKDPAPRLRLRTRKGIVHERTLVPGMIAAGAIIDPVIMRTSDWLALFDERDREHAASITFIAPEPEMDSPEIDVRIVREALPTARDVTSVLRELHAPVFGLSPFEMKLPLEGGMRRDHHGTLLLAHAPAKLRFHLPEGSHRVSGIAGVLEPPPGKAYTGGVLFRAYVLQVGADPSLVWSRTLDPRTREADREPCTFTLDCEVGPGAELVLRTALIEPDRGVIEGAYWGNLVLE